MKIVTETDRLIIRHYKEEDFPAFAEMNADIEVMKHFPNPLSKSESRAMFERLNSRLDETGKSFWAVEVKENNDFIGFVGLSEPSYEMDFMPCTEIGWRLRSKYWGKGYATEAAKACLEVGWNEYELNEILSTAVTANLPSIHIMKKLGMTYVKNFIHPSLEQWPEIEECVLYSLKRDID